MLIDFEESRYNPQAKPAYPSPVAGASINDTIPTSADVHLYKDPTTDMGNKPMLYADCEGLNAGETPPVGSIAGKRAKLQKFANGRVRHLEWATTDETRTRQFAVTKLYPRLLYTFSDVVVFVTKNPK